MNSHATQIHHAEISTGAVLSAKTGVAIPEDELVLVLTGHTDVGGAATARALPLKPEISEFVLFTVPGTGGPIAVAIDLTQPEASEFMARGVRHGYPILMVNKAGEALRFLKVPSDLTSQSAIEEMWRYQAMQRSPEGSKTFLRFIGVFGGKMGEVLSAVEADVGEAPVQSAAVQRHVVINANHRSHLRGKTVSDLVVAHTVATQRATQGFLAAVSAIDQLHRKNPRQKSYRLRIDIPSF